MGAKSICGSTAYTHKSQYTGNCKGSVRVRSCRVGAALGLGVHHCIVVECDSKDKWVVFEWGSDNEEFYACKSIKGQDCMYLGEHTLDEVYEAASWASDGSSYGTRYNCNHWTETVAERLGYNITVHWNCSCVL